MHKNLNKFKFVSLGNHCGVKLSLIKMNILQETYPFDYITSDNDILLTQIIMNKSLDWLNFSKYVILNCHCEGLTLSNLVSQEFSNISYLFNDNILDQISKILLQNNKQDFINVLIKFKVDDKIILKLYDFLVANTKIRLINEDIMFVHDHTPNKTLWLTVKEKYIRRLIRFYDLSKQDKEIVFIRSHFNNQQINYSLFRNALDKHFKNYKILFIIHDPSNETCNETCNKTCNETCNKTCIPSKFDQKIYIIKYNLVDPYDMCVPVKEFLKFTELNV